jgi:predicted DNA-binding transcriptional regulator YafY
MRADRLIQIVLLLQKRHTMSARELAEELGVSRRSIYRDIDALALIGIPVYAEQGSEGGYRLVEDYRTSLSGLTRDELSALLALSFPEPLTDLEIGQKIKTALLKLYANVPPRQQEIYLDWTPRGLGHESVPHLQKLYGAIQEDRRIIIHYRLFGSVDIEREVEPYGLIAQAGVWYLIYAGDGGVRHRRASELIEVKVLEKPFARPPNFDLERYWKALSAELEDKTVKFKTVLRLSPAVFRWLPHLLGNNAPTFAKETHSDGWIRLELCFDSFEAARKQILALGGGVEVLEPEALRLSVQDFAAQILQVYT